mmetsp:Transcript_26530/g.83074  ORF Transcript_26530/g.83074 Transcript_26530/m.83074 type:complete len:90 (-) Transcript_26530:349-618(-)
MCGASRCGDLDEDELDQGIQRLESTDRLGEQQQQQQLSSTDRLVLCEHSPIFAPGASFAARCGWGPPSVQSLQRLRRQVELVAVCVQDR